MRSRAITIAATPTLIAQGGSRNVPKSIAIQVPGDGTSVFIGGNDVTTANGLTIAPGGVITVDLINDSVFGIVASGTQVTRVLERNA